MNAAEWLADFAGVDESWRLQAACRGMDAELFFPGYGAGVSDARNAKRICRGCPVQAECLDAGLSERYGVWGGLSENDRAQVRRVRRRGAA